MNLLLDTHVFMYLVQQPSAIPVRARAAIEDPGNARFLSLASPWEMQIKSSAGKLTMAKPVHEIVQFEVDRGSITLLPISLPHIAELSQLPMHHRDPFDRILIAQAIHDGLTLVTADQHVRNYSVQWLWG